VGPIPVSRFESFPPLLFLKKCAGVAGCDAPSPFPGVPGKRWTFNIILVGKRPTEMKLPCELDSGTSCRRPCAGAIAMVGQVVGSPTVVTGWIYHLFNSAVIGAIFGLLAARRELGYGAGLGFGAAYGFIWWILVGLILMPMFLGMQAFAPLMMEPMRPVALGSLMGHLIYGLILGGVYVAVLEKTPATYQHS
jgi:hypothetical protein